MAKSLMMSIKPRWVNEIVSGKKDYEFRRRPPSHCQQIACYIYSCSPISAIVAKCKACPPITAEISTIWRRFRGESNISRAEFDTYFTGKLNGSAVKLIEIQLIQPITRNRLIEMGVYPPQSWCWLDDDLLIGVV